MRWPDGANDARVLCYDEAGMRWRVSGRVYEGPAEVNALAWSPVTRAGEPETIALALGADVGLFRMDGRALMDDGSSGAGVGVSSGGARRDSASPGACRGFGLELSREHPRDVGGGR